MKNSEDFNVQKIPRVKKGWSFNHSSRIIKIARDKYPLEKIHKLTKNKMEG